MVVLLVVVPLVVVREVVVLGVVVLGVVVVVLVVLVVILGVEMCIRDSLCRSYRRHGMIPYDAKGHRGGGTDGEPDRSSGSLRKPPLC